MAVAHLYKAQPRAAVAQFFIVRSLALAAHL